MVTEVAIRQADDAEMVMRTPHNGARILLVEASAFNRAGKGSGLALPHSCNVDDAHVTTVTNRALRIPRSVVR